MDNNKEQSFSIKRVLLGLIPVLIVIVIAVFVVSSNDKKQEVVQDVKKEPSRTEVCVQAQMLIEQTLKSPATADFPVCNDFSITRTTDGGYIVESYVDSQNGFGALIRTDFTIAFSYINGGKQVITEALTVDGKVEYVRETE